VARGSNSKLGFQRTVSESTIEMMCLSALISGKCSFFYKNNLSSLILRVNPDLTFVDEEPWRLDCLQIFLSVADIPFVRTPRLAKPA
jgi:hypothetical protein